MKASADSDAQDASPLGTVCCYVAVMSLDEGVQEQLPSAKLTLKSCELWQMGEEEILCFLSLEGPR